MLITGAKGFAIQLMDACLQEKPGRSLYFYDDINKDCPDQLFGAYPVLKSEAEAGKYFQSIDDGFALGTGNPAIRRMMFEKFIRIGGRPVTVQSPNSIIGKHQIEIGEGCCILTNSVIESTVRIGRGSLINLNVIITHGTSIGAFCEVSPGVQLLGNARIGNQVFIGAGAILLPGVSIGDSAVIGAGAVVNKDVQNGVTVKGIPAKPK